MSLIPTFDDMFSLVSEERRWKLYEKIVARCTVDYTQNSDVTRCCWLWTGGHSGRGRGGGYGRMRFAGGWIATHIAMFIIFFGPVPSKRQIDHTCNNRACCNPFHLECVSHTENQRRRVLRRKKKA